MRRATRQAKDDKLTGIDEARRRIAEAASTGATVLDLGGLSLTEVPEELYALGQLKVLYLGAAEGVREKPYFARAREDNAVRALPPALFNSLPHLTHLHLEHNHLTGLPDEIAALTRLTSLDLGGNQIRADGARAIAAVTSLTSLNLQGNRIGADGARAIAALAGLASLDLKDNRIGDDGARAIATMTNLTWLRLTDNEIGDDGAAVFASLYGLTTLRLGTNRIGADGARAIAKIAGLEYLNLYANEIDDEAAKALSELTGLTWLRLSRNRIGTAGARAMLDAWAKKHGLIQFSRLEMQENNIGDVGVPTETIESGDAQAIFAAYRAFHQAKQQGLLKPLNEAKMLVVGNEAVGKTSLIRYLVHGKPRDPDEKKTPGTNIHEKIEIQNWSPDAADIKLNVWDFGGQEIMHGTHRYFLTRRSLYLLVLEDRREDNCPIHNWLKIIRNRGGDAPIIVVINKSDEGKEALRLDEDGLKRDYPEIVGFLRTSCDPGKWAKDSIHALRKMIADCLVTNDGLKEVRDAVPESWLWVKQRIAERARAAHVLPISKFEGLCLEAAEKLEGAESLKDKATQRALLRLLHDLGILIVHGLSADDVSVNPSVALLDPNWLTGAIYTVLNRAELVHQKGKFKREQLGAWLDPTRYPASRYNLILRMMQDEEIGLAFELPGSKGKHFLVPEGLPKNSPDHSTWPPDSLRFRFRYQFLPPGLIPRLIVAANENLTEKEDKWHCGAVFQYRGCCVLVEGDVKRNVIDIAVADGGDNRRAALHVMLNYFDQVHALNPEALPEAFVPMPDDPNIEEGYKFLLQLEKEEGPDYRHRPTGSKHAYRIGDLLDGVGRQRASGGDGMSGAKISGVNVTVVQGSIHGDHIEISPRQTSQVEHATQPLTRPPVPSPSQGSWRWGMMSVGSGLGAVIAVVIVVLLPAKWQLPMGGLLALFAAVTAFMFFRNPDWFYKRMISLAMAAGLFWSAFGAFLEIKIGQAPVLTWKQNADPAVYLLVAVAIVVFTWADVRLQLESKSNPSKRTPRPKRPTVKRVPG